MHLKTEKKHTCSSCGKKFKRMAEARRCFLANNNRKLLWRYTKKNPQDKLLAIYQCTLCSVKGFASLDLFEIHIRDHAGDSGACPDQDCSQKVKSSRNILHHYLSYHTPFRPFKCGFPGCWGYNAVQSGNVRSHILAHLNSKQAKPQPKTRRIRKKRKQKAPTSRILKPLTIPDNPNVDVQVQQASQVPIKILPSFSPGHTSNHTYVESLSLLSPSGRLSLPPTPTSDSSFSSLDERFLEDPDELKN